MGPTKGKLYFLQVEVAISTFVDFHEFPHHMGLSSANNGSPSSTITSNSISITASSGIAIRAAEEAARHSLYLNSIVEANPAYQYDFPLASVAAHSAQMNLYLQGFDDAMEDKN